MIAFSGDLRRPQLGRPPRPPCRCTANSTASRLTWAKSARIGGPEPNSSMSRPRGRGIGSSAWLRMSVTRCWRVRMCPRMMRASVYRVSSTQGCWREPSPREHRLPASYAAPSQRQRYGDRQRPPGARGHQVLGAVLQALVQRASTVCERVDLVGGLVGPELRDAREPQREARLVAVRAHRSRRTRSRRRRSAPPRGSGRRCAIVCASNQVVISAISASVRPL